MFAKESKRTVPEHVPSVCRECFGGS
jgi:hypothetical protein